MLVQPEMESRRFGLDSCALKFRDGVAALHASPTSLLKLAIPRVKHRLLAALQPRLRRDVAQGAV